LKDVARESNAINTLRLADKFFARSGCAAPVTLTQPLKRCLMLDCVHISEMYFFKEFELPLKHYVLFFSSNLPLLNLNA